MPHIKYCIRIYFTYTIYYLSSRIYNNGPLNLRIEKVNDIWVKLKRKLQNSLRLTVNISITFLAHIIKHELPSVTPTLSEDRWRNRTYETIKSFVLPTTSPSTTCGVIRYDRHRWSCRR